MIDTLRTQLEQITRLSDKKTQIQLLRGVQMTLRRQLGQQHDLSAKLDTRRNCASVSTALSNSHAAVEHDRGFLNKIVRKFEQENKDRELCLIALKKQRYHYIEEIEDAKYALVQ